MTHRRATRGGEKAPRRPHIASTGRMGLRDEIARRVALYASQVASGGQIDYEPRPEERED